MPVLVGRLVTKFTEQSLPNIPNLSTYQEKMPKDRKKYGKFEREWDRRKKSTTNYNI